MVNKKIKPTAPTSTEISYDELALEALTELSTINDVIRWGASRFIAAELSFGHGIDNAWDEATSLALSTIHFPADAPERIGNAQLTTSERRQVINLFKRRIIERRPAAYLTNEAWFAGLPFYVDERVLIPRSPLAELIERKFAPWLAEQQIEHILDIGTGSGCIAIACALALPNAYVDAVDISQEALAVAQINVKRHEVTDQVQLINSDLYQKLERTYDVIISNPPYVPIAQMKKLPTEYQHEPTLGLAAGKKGIDIVIRILQNASNYLNSEGILIVEVGEAAAALEEHFPKIPFLWLDFERGGDGVFLLTAAQIHNYRHCLI